jgi:hypothetical protein
MPFAGCFRAHSREHPAFSCSCITQDLVNPVCLPHTKYKEREFDKKKKVRELRE